LAGRHNALFEREKLIMKRILITYATLSGTTVEVAQAIGEEITKKGPQVDVLPLEKVASLDGYDGVVLGGPMIMGWHRSALGFLRKNRKVLSRIPLAIFVMAMSLTKTSDTSIESVQLYIDSNLPKPPIREGHLTFREDYANVVNYARPILNASGPARPLSIGFFGGRLDYGRLAWWAVIFVMLVIQAPAGDRRNWPAIRAWAAGIPETFRNSANSNR
jgi:menaquinone-dependent protoporphyrinogen oxidase